jgi:cyclic pyranopterin phosphate synthase
VVVIAGYNDDEVMDLVTLAKTRPVNIRFIEFMPFKFNNWNKDSFVASEKIRAEIERYHRLIPVNHLDNIPGPAKDYKIDGFAGPVSFITSISDHFCSTCNRIRVTANGSIKSCLFSSHEINILNSLRNGTSDPEIKKILLQAVSSKPEYHLRIEDLLMTENRAMIQIGG